MNTKTILLDHVAEIEMKLDALRRAIENPNQMGEILALEPTTYRYSTDTSLAKVFADVRQIWNIPANLLPTMPLAEVSRDMSDGLPPNWASQEIVKMREE